MSAVEATRRLPASSRQQVGVVQPWLLPCLCTNQGTAEASITLACSTQQTALYTAPHVSAGPLPQAESLMNNYIC